MNKAVKKLSIPFALLRVFTIAAPVTLAVAFTGCSVTTPSNSEITSNTENQSTASDGAVITSLTNNGIKLTSSQYSLTSGTYSAGDNYNSADDSSLNVCRLTAESDNGVALTAVTWKASWADKTVGLNANNYVSITNVTSDGLTVQVSVKQAFGYPIVITATSSDNENATGSVTINYLKRISSFSVSMGTISTVATSNYSVNVSSLTGTGTLSPKAVTYAYYIKFSSDFSDTAYSYIPISKTMKGTEWYELISGYAKSDEVLENLTDNESNQYVSIYVTATVTYGGVTYQFLTSEALYPSFTNLPKLDVTISDGTTSQEYSDSDSETVSGVIGDDGSISTDGSYDLEANTDYTFTPDEDGTYTFANTSGDGSDITISDSSGNEWTIEDGESADIALSAGETLDITTDSASQLIVDSGSSSSSDSGSGSGISTSGNSFSTLKNEITVAVSGAAEDYTVSVSTELTEAVTVTETDSGITITKNDAYADKAVSGTVTITSGGQSIVIDVSFEITLTVATTSIVLSDVNGTYTDIAVSGGNGTYTFEVSSGLTGSVTCSWVDDNTLRLTYSYDSDVSGTIKVISGSQSVTISVSLTQPYVECLTGDTLITMADGSLKRIDQIASTDKVLSIDPETGEFCASAITYTDAAMNKEYNHYDRFEFEDGTVITTVHRHRFYNVEDQRMIHIDSFTLGDRAYKQDGTSLKLVFRKEHYEEKTVKHYTIFCEKQNYFANGLLSGNRFTKEIHKGGKS